MLFIPHRSSMMAKQAEEPIKCFKLLVPSRYNEQRWWIDKDTDKVYYSLFESFRYEEGGVYYDTRWGAEPPNYAKIFGYRSWANSLDAFATRWNVSLDTVVVEMQIPKGTKYFVNPQSGEYFSQSIICVGYYPIQNSLWDSLSYPFTRIFNRIKYR